MPDCPSSKRQRTSSPDVEIDPSSAHPLLRSAMWYDDGNVILTAERIQSKVYKGVLSAHSEVFQDMFSLPPLPDEDKKDECSVVHLSDAAFDVEQLLKMMFERSYFTAGPQPMKVVAALLRLGRKYIIPQIYDEALSCLTTDFPATLKEWNAHKNIDFKRILEIDSLEVEAIVLARELNLLSILPIAFYRTAAAPYISHAKSILSDRSLSPRDKALVLVGREELFAYQHEQFWTQSLSEDCCRADARPIFDACFKPPGTLVLLDPWKEHWQYKICEECCEHGKRVHNLTRRNLWSKLPAIFELDDWDVLKANSSKLR
ncbi:hypothetical protein JAAARDRAFT_79138 [Jaapia argillacea MUCL 33604]|uniref:BTB domain-containing protein n=1 Tax=Jaapia argillacea MUCL 33604 TaxID=933084 RepID=A0A067PS08_9AGAM|nr:hypothetical protein JAAARDRAFT_79138 [Jaapia argillacea MUCL 33604]